MIPLFKGQWEKFVAKIDGMSLRERALIFAAAAFLLVSLINALFLDPLLAQQKKLSMQVIQQQEKMKDIQAQLEALVQAKKDDANSPLRDRMKQIQQQLREGEIYLKSRRDKLVPPERMGGLLEQVLSKNGHLQLVEMATLPVTPLIEASAAKPEGGAVTVRSAGQERQVYKHGVKITVRGSYADLLQYLAALEKLPTQMFWGSAKMSAAQYPSVELTLTLYTLSLDTVWLQV
ncbi:MAG: agglutinin biogenesis protein [Gallionellaceae bacterium]|nr:MAG: agglutinin biogenesis protein [Gallionellaceae bacterium]